MSPDQLARVIRHPLFRGLDHDRLMPHIESLNIRCYAHGERVADPALRRSALHLVLSGRLLVFDLTPGGRRVVVDYVEAGGLDGLLSVAGLRGHFIEAALACELVTLARPVLDAMLLTEPRLSANLFWFVSRRLRRREDQIVRLSLRDPSQRIAAQLLAMADAAERADGEQTVAPRLSHEALADLLGLRRETVTLHLSRLRRLGAIRVEDHQFRMRVGLLRAVRDGEVSTGPI